MRIQGLQKLILFVATVALTPCLPALAQAESSKAMITPDRRHCVVQPPAAFRSPDSYYGIRQEDLRKLSLVSDYHLRLAKWYLSASAPLPNAPKASLPKDRSVMAWESCENMSRFAAEMDRVVYNTPPATAAATAPAQPVPEVHEQGAVAFGPSSTAPAVPAPTSAYQTQMSNKQTWAFLGERTELYVCNSDRYRIALGVENGRIIASLAHYPGQGEWKDAIVKTIGEHEVTMSYSSNSGCQMMITQAGDPSGEELKICLPGTDTPVLKGRMALKVNGRSVEDVEKTVHCEIRSGFEEAIRPRIQDQRPSTQSQSSSGRARQTGRRTVN